MQRGRRAPRASQACESCVHAKARCDNFKTCQRCRQRNIPCHRPDSFATAADSWLDGTRIRSEKRVRLDLPSSRQQSGGTAINCNDAVEEEPPNSAATTLYTPEFRQNTIDSEIGYLNVDIPEFDDIGTFTFPFTETERDATIDIHPMFGVNSESFLHLIGMGPFPSIHDTMLQIPQSSNDTPSENEKLVLVDVKSPEVSEAYEKTVGHWHPESQNHRATEEQNLFLATVDKWSDEDLSFDLDDVHDDKISPETRDRVLTMILEACDPANVIKVVSAFPGAGIIQRLIHRFFSTHTIEEDSWIHIPTFRSDQTSSGLLVACIATGALSCSKMNIRNFGIGLISVLHLYLFQQFEKEIAKTRQLEHVQALTLFMQTGLWKGDKRIMEISEAVVGPVLTMLRSGRHYRSSGYLDIVPQLDDEGDILEDRWRQWAHEESFKRLAFHMHIHCSKESLTSGKRSPISHAELSLPLPHARQLWTAKSASQWKEIYIQLQEPPRPQPPSIREYLSNPLSLQKIPRMYDSTQTILTVLHCIAVMIWDYRHNSVAFASDERNTNRINLLYEDVEHRRLSHLLQTVGMLTKDHDGSESSGSQVVIELLSMYLFTPFDQIELAAGREGPNEAQKAYPILRSWYQSNEARQASWHAGQAIRLLRDLPSDSFTEFYAIVTYQVSLCLWVYGSLVRVDSIAQQQHPNNQPTARPAAVLVDGNQNTQFTQVWITFNRGIPAISSPSPFSKNSSNDDKGPTSQTSILPLHSPGEVMLCIRDMLQSKIAGRENIPIFTGISDLMHALSKIH